MAQQQTPADTAADEPQKKSSTGARLLVAAAFSSLGGKLFLLGLPLDANAALSGGEKLTLGQKFKGIFNGTLKKKLSEKIDYLVKVEHKGNMRAFMSVMKFTLIIGAAGAITGAVVGWVRGGKVESWRDIFKHPVKSSKLVLGVGKHGEAVLAEAPAGPEEPAAKWTNSIQPRSSHAEEALKPKEAASPALGA